jgi:hypothetical protein
MYVLTVYLVLDLHVRLDDYMGCSDCRRLSCLDVSPPFHDIFTLSSVYNLHI